MMDVYRDSLSYYLDHGNNGRKMKHEPMARRYSASRGRRMKRTQPKQGKLRNKRHSFT